MANKSLIGINVDPFLLQTRIVSCRVIKCVNHSSQTGIDSYSFCNLKEMRISPDGKCAEMFLVEKDGE